MERMRWDGTKTVTEMRERRWKFYFAPHHRRLEDPNQTLLKCQM